MLRPRRWFVLLLIAAAIYACWCGALYLGQDHLIFRQDLIPALRGDQREWAQAGARMTLTISDGNVEALFFAAPGACAEKPAPLAVFCHGNAELAAQQAWLVEHYHALGYSVLLPEYRGYGSSAGRPSQTAIVSDAETFLGLALQRSDVDPARLVIHGRSLGGGVAAQLAAAHPAAGLILESTFTSLAAMAGNYYVPEFLARHPFHTDHVLRTSNAPVLIVHGSHDRVIPVEHARRNRALARRAHYVEYACDHHDFPGRGNEEALWEEIREFLKKLERPR